MKLYIYPFAPNAVKVQIFLAEKGIAVEEVDASADRAAYHKINPLGQVPALALDDGRLITESLTICQYLDATSPPPHLFGDGLDERTEIAMWERRGEQQLLNPGVEYGHHVHPMFAQWMTQFPDWAAAQPVRAERFLAAMADRLATNDYLAASRFTMADLTTYLGLFGYVAYGALPKATAPGVRAWCDRIAARPAFATLAQSAKMMGMPTP